MTRNAQKDNKRYPFTLKLTFEERARLEREANGLPLAEHIRARLFDGHAPEKRRRRGHHPVKDHQILARVLGQFGQSRMADNLNALAKAANSGSLPMTPETEHVLRHAAAEIVWIRKTLLKALGLGE